MEPSNKIIVGVSDAKLSADRSAIIATYSLGSCIGVSMFDPVVGIGGLLHFQLPSGATDAQRRAERPLMFADSGTEQLLRSMEAHGALRNRIQVKLAGAAEMMDESKTFNIGRRNHTAIRKVLWQHGMMIQAEDIGGGTPRTMFLNLSDGKVTIKADTRTTTL